MKRGRGAVLRWIGIAALLMALGNVADAAPPELRAVTVGADGILRWKDSGEEAAFFGCNYLAPFTYTYRALSYVGASREETIRHDILHLSRMGVNAIRLVAWECEISDAEGNLTPNDHLRLLDFTLSECRNRGIYVLLTPIFWGGNGYPEADELIKGFSLQYPKREMGVNPAAVRATARYLSQFVRHVNPFTELAYKDDNAVVAIELSNEPWAPPANTLTAYINGLTKAVREMGCQKPLLFCVSQGAWKKQTEAIGASNLEGVTFGWYPTGLVTGRTIPGNYLPVIDDYPLMQDAALANKTKFVYEFDAADLGSAFMYPAFARTFRTNGVQWATQFIYGPLPLAGTNTPYQTHFMNLVYAPRQAMSLLIASEAFRTLPRNAAYGRYPENAHFGSFRVSYEQDISEMATDTALLYSNDTTTIPPNPKTLDRVAGCGSSPVVEYEGTGCYFLNKIASGVWRLEVYPDALWIDDPHAAPRLDREASRILWREWPMTVNLPDLGGAFRVKGANPGNSFAGVAKEGRFPVRPGVYRLHGADAATVALTDTEFYVPPETPRPTAIIHRPPIEASSGSPLRIAATVASSRTPDSVTLNFRLTENEPFQTLPMRRERGYLYSAVIPAKILRPGSLSYTITARVGEETRSFPVGQSVAAKESSIALFEPTTPLHVAASGNASAPPNPDAETDGEALLVRARTLGPTSAPLTVTLATKSGLSYTGYVTLTPQWETHRLPLASLLPSEGYIMLRRPSGKELSAIRFSLPPGIESVGGAEIARVAYGPERENWETILRTPDAAPVLFDAARDGRESLPYLPFGGQGGKFEFVEAKDGNPAFLALSMQKFGKPPEIGMRFVLDARWNDRRRDFARYDAVRVRLRAAQEKTKTVSLSLIDQQGRAWTAALPVTQDWDETTIFLSAFRLANAPAIPFGYPTAVSPVLSSLKDVPATIPLENLMAIQFLLTPAAASDSGSHGIEIQRVTLTSADAPPKAPIE